MITVGERCGVCVFGGGGGTGRERGSWEVECVCVCVMGWGGGDIGQFSEAGLLEWMRFVIFRERSRDRSQRTSWPISE